MINGNKPGHGLKFLDVDPEKINNLAASLMPWQLDTVDPALIEPCRRVVIDKR